MGAVCEINQPGVRGFLHRPEGAGRDGLVLTHGASSDCRAALLVAAAEALSAAGLCVLRCDLPFRQRRPRGPPSPSGAAADRAGLRDAVGALRALVPGRVFLGGHSYGGRQATMLAAEDPAVAATRECMEEICARVETTGLIGVFHISKQDAPSTVGIAYKAILVDGSVPSAGAEMLEVRVFPVDSPPPLAFPSHQKVLAEFVRSQATR